MDPKPGDIVSRDDEGKFVVASSGNQVPLGQVINLVHSLVPLQYNAGQSKWIVSNVVYHGMNMQPKAVLFSTIEMSILTKRLAKHLIDRRFPNKMDDIYYEHAAMSLIDTAKELESLGDKGGNDWIRWLKILVGDDFEIY